MRQPMILYFDNYITQASLTTGAPVWSDRVRKGKAGIYRMPSKLDISLYTLASYAALDWSAVVIKYELEDKSQASRFESGVRALFPNAVIIPRRSGSQAAFQESARLLRSLGDEWIFYAGNNDHPFVGASKEALEHCLEKAAELKKTHQFVSIYLSQMLEGLGAMDKGSLRRQKGWEKLGEDKWRAFGWEAREINGHSHEEIIAALSAVPFKPGRPSVVIAHTVKGKGVSFMEGELAWHYKSPDAAQLESACGEIDEESSR